MANRKQKTSRPAARSQSMQHGSLADVPALPPRPLGGLPSKKHSLSSEQDDRSPLSHPIPPPYCITSSVPASASFLSETASVAPPDSAPPPIPNTPRPHIDGFSSGRPPAPLPPPTALPPPPLLSPLPSPSRQPQQQPQPPQSPDSRYTKRPQLTPSIGSSTMLTEDQLRAHIDMQSQNTEELLQMLQGHEEDTMTPTELVGKFGKLFPLRVRVEKGFYSKRAEIVTGEVYNIHFLKNARVISISDGYGEKFVLPLNAAMRIGYDQKNQPDIYNNALEIITTTEPPKLICPRDNFKAKEEENSFKKDEVMIVKGVHIARVRRNKSLVVVSLKTLREKRIPADCMVQFSTDPFFTQIPLLDAVNQVPELIPGTAKLCPTVDVEDIKEFPDHLVSETVTIRRQYVERSLITTLEEQEGARPADPFALSPEPPTKSIYDLPLSLDIEFSIIPPEPEEDLYAYTHQLCQEFDPRKIKSGDGTGLNMALDESNIYSGMEFELPPYMNYDPAAPVFKPPGAAKVVDETPPPLPSRHSFVNDIDGDDYSAVDYSSTAAPIHIAQAEHPPPLPTSLPPTSRPPPLPTSPPPTSRPAAYQATQLKAPQPPNTSPKPKRRTPQTTPPTPRAQPAPGYSQPVPAVEAAKKEKSPNADTEMYDSDEYVDLEDQIPGLSSQRSAEPALLPPLPPSTTSSKYPLVALRSSRPPRPTEPLPITTTSFPLKPSPPATIDSAPHTSSASADGTVLSPVSSAGSYVDAETMPMERPRLPSPVHEMDRDASSDYEIMQQFSDLQHTVQTGHAKLKEAQQQETSPSHSTTELKRLQDDLKRVASYPQKIISYCMSLEREMSTLRGVVKDQLVRSASSIVMEENRQFLATLTIVQIVKILEMMNMKQYQDRFAQESIDGAILMEIEETTLETELGVTSKLHRVKLLKIISGERSAKSVLEGQYNYVALQPQK